MNPVEGFLPLDLVRELDHRLNPAENLLLWQCADESINLTAIFQHQQRRDAANAEPGCGHGVLISVELGDFHSPGELAG